VALVALADAPDPLRLPEDQQVVYELGVWPLGLQAAAAQAMAESGIPHGWDGTDLVVHLDHEAAVDALLDEIESAQPGVVGAGWLDNAAADDAAADVASAAPGAGRLTEAELEDAELLAEGGAGDELEYELDEWLPADRRLLSDRLDAARMRYRWEGDDVLVVAMADEAAVEALLDEVEYPDALPADEADLDDDEVPFELMSGLFVAADRLKANPRDPDGIEGLIAFVSGASPARPPFGVDPAVWVGAIVQADELADRIAGGGDEDGDGLVDGVVDEEGEPVFADDDLVARAATLRDLLRPYI
jgi:hypothetical protein